MQMLTNQEEMVMKAIWDCKEDLVLSSILRIVRESYQQALCSQTVSTYLAKLVRKNYIKLCRDGKIYYYEILISQDEYRKFILQHVFHYLYLQDKEKFLEHFNEILKRQNV